MDTLKEQLQVLLQLAKDAGNQDLSTAEEKERFRTDCPLCDGDGTVNAETYRNYDNAPTGVQFFFGIGEEHLRAKAYWEAMKPAHIIPILEAALALLSTPEEGRAVLTEEEIERIVADVDEGLRVREGRHVITWDYTMFAEECLKHVRANGYLAPSQPSNTPALRDLDTDWNPVSLIHPEDYEVPYLYVLLWRHGHRPEVRRFDEDWHPETGHWAFISDPWRSTPTARTRQQAIDMDRKPDQWKVIGNDHKRSVVGPGPRRYHYTDAATAEAVCDALNDLVISPSHPTGNGYAMSKDYEALWARVHRGGEALGFVREGDMKKAVWIRCIGEMGQSAIGDYGYCDNEEDFLAECKRMNLEWLAPSPTPVQPSEEGLPEDQIDVLANLYALKKSEHPDFRSIFKPGDRTTIQAMNFMHIAHADALRLFRKKPAPQPTPELIAAGEGVAKQLLNLLNRCMDGGFGAPEEHTLALRAVNAWDSLVAKAALPKEKENNQTND